MPGVPAQKVSPVKTNTLKRLLGLSVVMSAALAVVPVPAQARRWHPTLSAADKDDNGAACLSHERLDNGEPAWTDDNPGSKKCPKGTVHIFL
jgi:hypothetical protein